MKTLDKIAQRQFLVAALAASASLALVGHPSLKPILDGAAPWLKLPAQLHWLPALLILVGIQLLLLYNLKKRVSEPLNRLSKYAERGERDPHPKTKSHSAEETSIRRAINESYIKSEALEDESNELEEQLQESQSLLKSTVAAKRTLEIEIEETRASNQALRGEFDELRTAKTALEMTLESERRAKAGVEVERHVDQIYLQMERAIEAASLKRIWIPSTVQELRIPASVIAETVRQISRTGAQVSFAQLQEHIETIRQQSDAQIKVLERILSNETGSQGSETTHDWHGFPGGEPEGHRTEEEGILAIEETGSLEAPLEERQAELPSQPTHSQALAHTREPDSATAIATAEPEPAEKAKGRESQTLSRPSLKLGSARHVSVAEAKKRLKISEKVSQTELAAGEAPSEPDSTRSLEALLNELVEQFQPQCPFTELGYAIDPELDLRVEDKNLGALLEALFECASSLTRSGEIVIAADLQGDAIIFAIACSGQLAPQPRADSYSKAEQLARELDGEVTVEASSENELHLGFEYRLAASRSQSSPGYFSSSTFQ